MHESEIKFAPGVGPRRTGASHSLTWLEKVTVAHVATFVLVTTWAFGGQADWLTTPLSWLGSLGLLITLTALQNHAAWREGWMRTLWWLAPLAAFNVLVLASTLNPSLREVGIGSDTVLVNSGGHAGLPSSARPALSLQALWLFDAIWISCFNIAFVIRQRRALRLLLLIAVTNAVVLSVFGTAQKLTHASGLYFGAVPSPQKAFFASFVYHNHWGAFMLLMISGCLGLIWHYGRRREARDFFHTPASAGIVVLLLMAATVPLSTSRSSTILLAALLLVALLHVMTRVIRQRRRFGESLVPPIVGIVAAVGIAAAEIWRVAEESITARLAKTEEQVALMREEGGIGDRATLYRDTWRMAKARPWFGWGMASYPTVFTLFNSESHRRTDNLPVFYHDAHSDWLQALAEHGFLGSGLLALCAILPLTGLRRSHLASPVPVYLLGGCLLLLGYAGIEFPFGNVAVVLCWWLCFFCAVQYVRLQDREAALSLPPLSSAPTR